MIKMRWEYVLIIICIMIVAVSGCTQDDSPLNYSSPASNTTNSSTTAVPTTTSSSTNPQAEVSGNCYKVVDGDTIDVEGVGRVRFVGVNTPERGDSGYQEAKD